MLFLTLLCSIIFVTMVAFSGFRERSAPAILVWCLVATVGGVLAGLQPVAMFGFLSGLACTILFVAPRVLAGAAIGICVLTVGLTFADAMPRVREREQLRQVFPIRSLATRLNHEARWKLTTGTEPELSVQPELRLAGFEENLNQMAGMDGTQRVQSLRNLHDRARDKFYWGTGFGVGRMRYIPREPVRLADHPRPELPSAPEYAMLTAGQTGHDLNTPEPDRLFALHDTGLRDFLNPVRFGWVQSRKRAAGFKSHRFDQAPTLAQHPEAVSDWVVTGLQLVSLLRHETPVVYEGDVPAMDELDQYTTRPLDGFEDANLQSLRTERDLVTHAETNRIRMLGSIRAGNQCLDCHDVQRGDLLGAFTYTLHRAEPVKAPPTPDA